VGSAIGKGATIAVGILMVLSAMVLVSQKGSESAIVKNTPESSPLIETNYVTHTPISISSNSNFASQAASEGWLEVERRAVHS